MKKVLILASGGLDSSVLLALYSNLNYEVHLMCFDYGNKNAELEYLKLNKLRHKFNIPPSRLYSIDLNINWSKSSCVNGGGNLYVEMRNLIFLSNAISFAEAQEMDEIAIGFIDAGAEYKDTSDDFLDKMNTLSLETIGVPIVAPLKQLDKVGVYSLGKKLGVDLTDTFSCNTPVDGQPCGECVDCKCIKELIKIVGDTSELNFKL